MKIVTKEERAEHNKFVIQAGAKGALIGGAISLGIFAIAKGRYPKRWAGMTASMKTATMVIPPAFCITVKAANASEHFGDIKYAQDESLQQAQKEEETEWSALSGRDKALQVLNNNKYKVITGLWALSMWGSWEYVNRDPLLSKAQKFYDARMYAQFITIALLLGSIGLSMAEEKGDKNKNKNKKFEDQADDDYMRKIMSQTRQAEQARKEMEAHKKREAEKAGASE